MSKHTKEEKFIKEFIEMAVAVVATEVALTMLTKQNLDYPKIENDVYQLYVSRRSNE